MIVILQVTAPTRPNDPSDNRPFVMRADTQKEKDSWVESIEAVILVRVMSIFLRKHTSHSCCI